MSNDGRHSSLTAEHYTPLWIVDKARELMGSIDCDPATSEQVNADIGAKLIGTKENPLPIEKWEGNVFLNPPGGLWDIEHDCTIVREKKNKKGEIVRPSCSVSGECGLPIGHKHKRKNTVSSQAAWWAMLMHAPFDRAVFVGFSIELLCVAQVFDVSQPLDFLCCFPSDRIDFDTMTDGGRERQNAPTHNNVLVFPKCPHAGVQELFGGVGYTTSAGRENGCGPVVVLETSLRKGAW